MENLTIYNKVRSVPDEALKTIIAGRLKGFSDINPMWRIKTLTEVFGVCGVGWKVEITDKWMEKSVDNTCAAFMGINLYVKINGEWSEAIPGTGGSSFISKEKNGFYMSDECYKMAYTDALSVACKMLGVAADVYYAKDRTKYDINSEQPTQPAQPTQPEVQKRPFVHEKVNDDKVMGWIYKNEKVSKESGNRFSVHAFVENMYAISKEDLKELSENYNQYKINNNLP